MIPQAATGRKHSARRQAWKRYADNIPKLERSLCSTFFASSLHLFRAIPVQRGF